MTKMEWFHSAQVYRDPGRYVDVWRGSTPSGFVVELYRPVAGVGWTFDPIGVPGAFSEVFGDGIDGAKKEAEKRVIDALRSELAQMMGESAHSKGCVARMGNEGGGLVSGDGLPKRDGDWYLKPGWVNVAESHKTGQTVFCYRFAGEEVDGDLASLVCQLLNSQKKPTGGRYWERTFSDSPGVISHSRSDLRISVWSSGGAAKERDCEWILNLLNGGDS